jgi:hypothetical protein
MGITVSPAAAKPPPVRNPKTTASAAKTTQATADIIKSRADALEELLAIPAVAFIMRKQFADAGTVQMYGPRLTAELASLEPLAPIIDPLTKIGPYSKLIAIIIPMALQFGVNHGQVPPGAMGTVPASTLAAQIETQIARQEVQALRIQLEAEREARELKAEIDEARNEVLAQASNA